MTCLELEVIAQTSLEKVQLLPLALRTLLNQQSQVRTDGAGGEHALAVMHDEPRKLPAPDL